MAVRGYNESGLLEEATPMIKTRPRDGFPTKVKVLNKVYKVIYYDGDKDIGKGKLWAEVDFNSNTISITCRKGDSRAEVAEHLWHEITHAIVNALAMDAVIKSRNEEDIVERISEGITMVLVDNKNMRFWEPPKKKGRKK